MRLLDSLPHVISNPFDPRLRQLALGIRALSSDWAISEMKGRECSKSMWLSHAAFVHGLVLYFKPNTIVDLGVFHGCSTIAMGLALKKLGRGKIYAVDTWEGDPHAGKYGDDVFDAFVLDTKELDLADYIIPTRMQFSQASHEIQESVDLLHVDGYHTFIALRSDFHAFRGHLKPGAVTLFHDVSNWGFPGLKLYWKYLSLRYRSFRFDHASGLGIILTDGGGRSLGLPIRSDLTTRNDVIRDRMLSCL